MEFRNGLPINLHELQKSFLKAQVFLGLLRPSDLEGKLEELEQKSRVQSQLARVKPQQAHYNRVVKGK